MYKVKVELEMKIVQMDQFYFRFIHPNIKVLKLQSLSHSLDDTILNFGSIHPSHPFKSDNSSLTKIKWFKIARHKTTQHEHFTNPAYH